LRKPNKNLQSSVYRERIIGVLNRQKTTGRRGVGDFFDSHCIVVSVTG